MEANDIFLGRKVWLRPNPLYREKYTEDLVETYVSLIGTVNFNVADTTRGVHLRYNIKTLKEVNNTNYKGEIVLNKDGDLEFDKKEQLIIKVRKYFNSRAVYNEDNEKIRQVIELLNL
jgi:hypothetical protein